MLSVAELLLECFKSDVFVVGGLFLTYFMPFSWLPRSCELLRGDCFTDIFDIRLSLISLISLMFCLMKLTLCCWDTLWEWRIWRICFSLN